MTGKQIIATVAINGFDELKLIRKDEATMLHLRKGDKCKDKLLPDNILYSLDMDVFEYYLRDMVKGFDNDLREG